jgi:hypothetical protein
MRAKEGPTLARDATRTAEWYIYVYKLVPCSQVSKTYGWGHLGLLFHCSQSRSAADQEVEESDYMLCSRA